MSEPEPPSEYLVLPRGQWTQEVSSGEIEVEVAIGKFYDWYSRNLVTGPNGARVTDGVFAEFKEATRSNQLGVSSAKLHHKFPQGALPDLLNRKLQVAAGFAPPYLHAPIDISSLRSGGGS